MESSRLHECRLTALIAHLYEAAMDPALWPGTASRIAQALGSTSAVVKLHGGGGQVSLLECTSNLVVSERDQAWANDWHRRDLWVERSVAHGMSRIITDQDLVTREEQARSGFYREWLPHLDIHHMLGAVFPTSLGAVGVLGIHRPRGARAYSDHDRRQASRVLPHLQRALRLGQRFDAIAHEHAVMNQALDRLDTGVLVVDVTCRILHANTMAETLLRENPELAVVQGRLSVRQTPRHRLSALVHAALEVANGRPGQPGSTLVIPRRERMPLTLEVAPLRPTASIFGQDRPAALVFISDPEAPIAAARLRELFGLTRTEATVAAALAQGQSLEDIATRTGIGLGTVRTHLKRILSKTGTHRQAQAVALLARSHATASPH